MTTEDTTIQRASALFAAGDLLQAEKTAMDYVRLRSHEFAGWYLLGVIRYQQTRYTEAVELLRHAFSLAPGHAELCNSLAAALAKIGDNDAAEFHYQIALRLSPAHPPYIRNYCSLLVGRERLPQAEQMLDSLLHSSPHDRNARLLAAEIALRTGNHDKAHAHTSQLLQTNPNDVAALIMASTIAYDAYDWTNARNNFSRALTLAPENDVATLNLAHTWVALGKYDQAEYLLRQALKRHPTLDMEFVLSLVELTSGNVEQGWRHFLARPSRRHYAMRIPSHIPLDCTGQRYTLVGDEGFGDILFFLRYVSFLKVRGARLNMVVPKRIVRLVETLPNFDGVYTFEEMPDDAPILPLGDLPHLLNLPPRDHYPPTIALQTNPTMVENLRSWLAQFGPPPYLGVTWAAGPRLEAPRHAWPAVFKKRIEPALLGAALANTPYTVVLLQRSAKDIDIHAFTRSYGKSAVNLAELSDDLSILLHLLSALDEYVCVSNTNVHLLSAIGRTSKVLLNHPAEWRWGIGDESQWFPGISLYRQSLSGDWGPALEELRNDLSSHPDESHATRA